MVVGASSPSPAFLRLQNVLKLMDGAANGVQGAEGPTNKKIGDSAAKVVLDEYDKLHPVEKEAARNLITEFLQSDLFRVTEPARKEFATRFGVDAEALKPRGAETPQSTVAKRSVLKQTMKLLTGPPKMNEQQIAQLRENLKSLNYGTGDFLISALQAASADGDVKFEGGAARKELVKEVASRNGDGRLDTLSRVFSEDFAKKVPSYILTCLSDPPLFEELIFILMITLVSDTQKEVMEEQKRISNITSADQKVSEEKANRTKALTNLQSAFVQKEVANPASGTKPTDTKDVKAAMKPIVNDGTIPDGAGTSVIAALEKMNPEEKKAFAEIAGTAIQHTNQGTKEIPEIAAIWSWAQSNAGPDGFALGTPALEELNPIAKALIDDPSPGRQAAGHLMDALVNRDEDPARFKKFDAAINLVVNQVAASSATAAATATATVASVPREETRKLVELVVADRATIDAAAKDGKPGAVQENIKKIVDENMSGQPPERKNAMVGALERAFAELPPGEAANDDIEKAVSVARGTLVDFVLDPSDQGVNSLLGGSIERALQKAAGSVENFTDTGRAPPTPEQSANMLKQALAEQKKALLEECRTEGGLNPAQLANVEESFDRAGDQELAKVQRTGTIEPKEPLGRGADGVDPEQTNDTRSRQIMFENLKFKMNMLSEMQQSMSAILNTMHQNSETTIRAIR